MTRSELIDALAARHDQLSHRDIELAVKVIMEHMTETLSNGGRVEIRGFGSFSLHHREARRGRNPKTGEIVDVPSRYVPHFKAGKELRIVVNNSLTRYPK